MYSLRLCKVLTLTAPYYRMYMSVNASHTHSSIATIDPKIVKTMDATLSYGIESVASMVTYILAMLLCVTKLTIYILLCMYGRTLHNLRMYIAGTHKFFGT